MPFNYGLCECTSIEPGGKYLLNRLIDELVECIVDPSLDELGDVMCITSQLLYKLTSIVIVLPFAEMSLAKGRDRYHEHGCVRSKRNSCS